MISVGFSPKDCGKSNKLRCCWFFSSGGVVHRAQTYFQHAAEKRPRIGDLRISLVPTSPDTLEILKTMKTWR